MIRARLALWNAVALAVVLVTLGGLLFASTRASLYRAVDDDLSARGLFLESDWRKVRGHDRHGHDHDRHKDDHHEPMPGPGEDPALSRRIAFDAFIARPRVLRADEVGATRDEVPWDAAAMARALKGRRESLDAMIEGHRVRVLSFPLIENGVVVAGGQFAAPLAAADAATDRLARAMLFLLPVALAVTSLMGFGLTRRALRPVAQITASAGRIEASSLSERLPEVGRDEFAELAHVFNAMLDRVEGSYRDLEEAYSAQRRFVADASHELKTPLATIKTRLGVALRKDQTPERYVEHLGAIQTASNSMSAIVGDLLLLARSDEGEPQGDRREIPLASLAEEGSLDGGRRPRATHRGSRRGRPDRRGRRAGPLARFGQPARQRCEAHPSERNGRDRRTP